LKSQSSELGDKLPRNLERKAISLIGRPLYEAFVRGYTLKQWQTDPRDTTRTYHHAITRSDIILITVTFSDVFEGLPIDGYTAIFERMLRHPNIRIELGIDYLRQIFD